MKSDKKDSSRCCVTREINSLHNTQCRLEKCERSLFTFLPLQNV